MLYKKTIIILLLLLFTLSSEATETQLFFFNQALSEAVMNNPEIQNERSSLGISEADILSQSYVLNPYLDIDAGFAQNAYRFGLEKTIELGNRRKNRINIAKTQFEIEKLRLNEKILTLKSEIRNAYIENYVDKQQLKAYQETYDAMKNLIEIANKKSKKTIQEEADIIESETTLLRISHEVATTEYDMNKSLINMQSLIGNKIAKNLNLKEPERMPKKIIQNGEFNANKLIELAKENRPALIENKKILEQLKYEDALNKASRLPIAILSSGYEMNRNPPEKHSGYISATIEIPVLDRQQGAIKKTEARKIQAEIKDKIITKQIENQINSSYETILLSNTRLDKYEKDLLPKMEENVNKAALLFKRNKASISVPMDALESYIDAQMGYYNALQDHQKAISDLEKATGINF